MGGGFARLAGSSVRRDINNDCGGIVLTIKNKKYNNQRAGLLAFALGGLPVGFRSMGGGFARLVGSSIRRDIDDDRGGVVLMIKNKKYNNQRVCLLALALGRSLVGVRSMGGQ